MDTPNHNTTNNSPSSATPETTLDILEIMALLPHRYPFLLIDRVVEMSPSTSRSSKATSPAIPSCLAC
jgi:predicted hotdog family 3-hydroxylacyl-ACP dehydratase